MFEVDLSNESLKILKKLDKKAAEKIKELLLCLKTSPLPIREYDIKKVIKISKNLSVIVNKVVLRMTQINARGLCPRSRKP